MTWQLHLSKSGISNHSEQLFLYKESLLGPPYPAEELEDYDSDLYKKLCMLVHEYDVIVQSKKYYDSDIMILTNTIKKDDEH